jgi:TusE/DsrC/DsvC family sulfur relay protein
MATIEKDEGSFLHYKGRKISVDADGHLVNLEDWSEELALAIADGEGIEMTDAHWEIVNCVRDYYKQFHVSLAIKQLVSEIAKKFGPGKGNTKYLYTLFSDKPTRLANKIGGLPRPIG